MITSENGQEAKTECYYRICLFAGNKLAFMEKSMDPIPAKDWDDPERRPHAAFLPTAVPEIAHCAKLVRGGDDCYFEVVDTQRDLTLTLKNAIMRMKESGWVKAKGDWLMLGLWSLHFASHEGNNDRS